MKAFLISIYLLIASFAWAQSIDTAKIHRAMQNYINQQGFSGTILIAEKGRKIFHQSYGLAYYSTPDSIKTNYHFSIASITKLFTSIRILQLVETGELSLEAPVSQYLKRFEKLIPREVTIHHILLHISGLNEERSRDYLKYYAPDDLVQKVLNRMSKSTFGEFNYNNIDYLLLGLLVEKVTGNDWQEEISKHILEPLNMKGTGFLKYGHYPEKFAYSYSKKRNKLIQDPLIHIENFYSAGNMYSTAEDLCRLDQALYGNQLLSDQSKKLLSKSYPEYNYAGYGVWNYRYPFLESKPNIMERRGGILGANVVLVRLTDEKYTIIILSNDDRFNPDSFGDESNLREILIRSLYP